MLSLVRLSRHVEKQLKSLPRHILINLLAWVDDVRKNGLAETRKCPGYHDEPLKGERRGQRSIRLSRNYRAIYEIHRDEAIEFIRVEEVTKHEY